MHLVAAWACLSAILLASIACLARPRAELGWWLVALSTLWFPLNNRVLEGTILFSVTKLHGLTTADLAGLAGLSIGALTAWPAPTWRGAGLISIRILALASLLALAVATAASITDVADGAARRG